MAIDKFNYSPEDVFNNATSYPDPVGEAQVREQLSRPHTQVRDFINNKLIPAVEKGQTEGNSYTDSKISSESSRAKAAEQSNSNAIQSEVSRAKVAEHGVINSVNSEVSRAKAAEQINSNAIQSEVTRAKNAENNIAEECKERNAGIDRKLNDISTSISYGLAVEKARAKAAEKAVLNDAEKGINSISINLSNEVSRAKAAEQSMAKLFNAIGLSVVNGKVCQTVKE